MKKIGVLLLFSFLVTTIFAQKDNSIPFPKFSLLKMDSASYLSNKDLKEHTNTVFINFSPTCEHCERTIKEILNNIQKFKETQFVLTSFEGFGDIRKFYFDNMLNSFPNVFIGQEKGTELTSQIKYTAFPCAVLFDKNNKWITKIEGETKPNEFLKALKIKGK